MADWAGFFVAEVGASDVSGPRPAYRFTEQSRDAANGYVGANPARGQNAEFSLFDLNDRDIPSGTRVYARQYGMAGGRYLYECFYVPSPDGDVTITGDRTWLINPGVTLTLAGGSGSVFVLDIPTVNIVSGTWNFGVSTAAVFDGEALFDGTLVLGYFTFPQFTTNKVDFDPVTEGPTNAPVLRVSTDALRDIKSVKPTVTTAGQRQTLRFINDDVNPLRFTHEDAAGTAAYRLKLPAGQDVTLLQWDELQIGYDTVISRWTLDFTTAVAVTSGSVAAGTYGDVNHYPVVSLDAAGRLTNVAQLSLPAASDSRWQKYTVNYNDAGVAVASTTATVTIRAIGSLEVLHGAILKKTTSWAGTGITGIHADLNTFDGANASIAFVDIGAFGNAFTYAKESDGSGYVGKKDFTGWNVTLKLTSAGANLNQLTAGVLDIWLRTSTLP